MNSKLEHRNIQVTLPSDGPSADSESIVAICRYTVSLLLNPTHLDCRQSLKDQLPFFVDCIRRSQEQNFLFWIFLIWINWKLSDEPILHFKQIGQLNKIYKI